MWPQIHRRRVGEIVTDVGKGPRWSEEAVDGQVESTSAPPVLAGAELRVQGTHVEQDASFLKGDRSLTAGGSRQRIIPKNSFTGESSFETYQRL